MHFLTLPDDFHPSRKLADYVLDEGERCYSHFAPGDTVEAVTVSDDGIYTAVILESDDINACMCWQDVGDRVRELLAPLPGSSCAEVIELCAVV